MKPTFSIFVLAIEFDCLFLAIFQTFQWFVSFIFDKLALPLPPEYEVCLKNNGTVHAARTTFIAVAPFCCFSYLFIYLFIFFVGVSNLVLLFSLICIWKPRLVLQAKYLIRWIVANVEIC